MTCASLGRTYMVLPPVSRAMGGQPHPHSWGGRGLGGAKPPQDSRYAMGCIPTAIPNTKQPNFLLHIDTKFQNNICSLMDLRTVFQIFLTYHNIMNHSLIHFPFALQFCFVTWRICLPWWPPHAAFLGSWGTIPHVPNLVATCCSCAHFRGGQTFPKTTEFQNSVAVRPYFAVRIRAF